MAAETDKGCSLGWLGFIRVGTRRRARKFVLGLLADLPCKNCWTIAEHAGGSDPHGMQHLLGGRDVHRGRLGAADDNTMSAPTITAAASTDPHGPRTAVAVLTEALQRLLYGDLDTSRHAGHIDWAAPCNLAANRLGSVVIMVKQGVQVPPRVESYARD